MNLTIDQKRRIGDLSLFGLLVRQPVDNELEKLGMIKTIGGMVKIVSR